MKQLLQKASGSLKNVQMPAGLDQKHQTLLTQLQQTQEPQFDKTYIQQQLQAHQTAVDMFRNYSQSGDNVQLKQFASQTLPILQQHLQMAQQLQKSLG
jgi:putative membrane protein